MNEVADSTVGVKPSEFRTELCSLLNRHSRENESDTPDFILCAYLGDCLNAFDRATRSRSDWYNKATTDSPSTPTKPSE